MVIPSGLYRHHLAPQGHHLPGPKRLDSAHEQAAAGVKRGQRKRQAEHLLHVGQGGWPGVDGSAKNVVARKLLIRMDIARHEPAR